jgi:hypothetical protein
MAEPVAMNCVYKSHRSTADGGFSISFDVSEDCADQINEIFKKKNDRLILVVMTEEESKSKLKIS